MRIKKMIKRGNSLIFFQILSTFFKEMYGDKSLEFACGYLWGGGA